MRLLLLFAVVGPALAQTVVLSPDGPIRTLAAARDAVRAERRAGRTGAVTVQVRDGIYFLPETLVLTPEDSDTDLGSSAGRPSGDQRGPGDFGMEEGCRRPLDRGCYRA